MTNIATVPGLAVDDLGGSGPQRRGTPDAAARPRVEAFRAAASHTARVRLLRRLVLAGAVLGSVGVVGYAFNPFRALSGLPGVTVDGVGLSGSKVTMQRPRLTGFRSDGRPYDLVASSAVQDAKNPSVLELHDIDAHVTMADQSVVHIVSEAGLYDSSKETMSLKSAIHLTSDKGLDARLRSAYIEFKTGLVDSREPVTVVNGTGTVSADSMHMTDNGAHVVFEGHVQTTIVPAADAAAATSSLKGTGP